MGFDLVTPVCCLGVAGVTATGEFGHFARALPIFLGGALFLIMFVIVCSYCSDMA